MVLIEQEVPEVANKHAEVMALIKTHIHEEKHNLWNNFKNQFKATLPRDERFFVDAKIETHWIKSQYKENLQWAKRYGKTVPKAERVEALKKRLGVGLEE